MFTLFYFRVDSCTYIQNSRGRQQWLDPAARKLLCCVKTHVDACVELTMAQTQNNIKKTSSSDLLTCGNGKGETLFERNKKDLIPGVQWKLTRVYRENSS